MRPTGGKRSKNYFYPRLVDIWRCTSGRRRNWSSSAGRQWNLSMGDSIQCIKYRQSCLSIWISPQGDLNDSASVIQLGTDGMYLVRTHSPICFSSKLNFLNSRIIGPIADKNRSCCEVLIRFAVEENILKILLFYMFPIFPIRIVRTAFNFRIFMEWARCSKFLITCAWN